MAPPHWYQAVAQENEHQRETDGEFHQVKERLGLGDSVFLDER